MVPWDTRILSMLKSLDGLTDAEEVGGSYQCLKGLRVLPMLKRLERLTNAEEVGGSYQC